MFLRKGTRGIGLLYSIRASERADAVAATSDGAAASRRMYGFNVHVVFAATRISKPALGTAPQQVSQYAVR
jgi:hypothetical protein